MGWWLIVATIVAIIVIFNERVIDEKRARIRELEDKQRTNMLQLKDVNDIVLTEEPEERESPRGWFCRCERVRLLHHSQG